MVNSVWPDLEKICQLGSIYIYIFGDFLMVYLEFNNIFSILSQFWMQLGKVSSLYMAKYWAKILQSGHTGHNTERVQKK